MPIKERSLQTRLTAGLLCAVVISLWVVALAIGRELPEDMRAAISAQQLSTVSLIGAGIDRSVRERTDVLDRIGRLVPAAAPPLALEAGFLERHSTLMSLFNWGIFIADARGVVVDGIPADRHRPGLDHAGEPYVREALASGKPTVSEPQVERGGDPATVGIAVPILGADGEVAGLIVGVTNLELPNFLDEIGATKYGETGEFVLTGPKSRIFIASSDKRRTLKLGPARGINPVYDGYIDGREGSGIAISSRGIEELTSSVRVPSTGWLMQAVLPTAEAFAPVAAMQRRVAAVSLVVTLVVGGLALWWIRRQLSPLVEASSLLDRMRVGKLAPHPLPVRREDEIGKIAVAFNGLLEAIAAHETAAAEAAANRLLRKILQRVPGMVFQYRQDEDGTGHFQFASEAAESIYGVSPDALMQDAHAIRSLMHPKDHDRLFGSLRQSAHSMQPWKAEYRIVRPQGDVRWLSVDALPEWSDDGQLAWFGIVTDVTATKSMELELRIAATTFESQEGIFITDAGGTILRVNRAFTRITGYSEAEAVGQTPALLSSGRHDDAFYRQLWLRLIEDGVWAGEIWNQRKSGEIFPEWVTISAVRDVDGRISHYVASFSDITERKETEQRIRHLAFFDPLTNLPNRRLLIDRIHQALAASQRSQQHGAVMFLDLDRFKILNDTKGHDVGDRLLVEVATRLKSCLRENDTVARLGGDEFVVLLQDLGEQASSAATRARLLADKLKSLLEQPYNLGEHRHQSSCSIGVTLFQGNAQSVEALLKQADVALYDAKAAGRNTTRFFDPHMQQQIDVRAALEAGLREAIRNDDLELHYQPQVDAAGRPTGAEALLRWFGPAGEAISPAQFVPLAEETGLIRPLGDWVLRTACRRLEAWTDEPALAGLVLAINISARQFSQPDFVLQVEQSLARHRIRPGRLMLELTESAVLHDVDEAIARMKHLKEVGVLLALDDFGTGYSSLSYLKRLPVDQVKIDRAFVRDVAVDPDDAAIVRTIVALGGMFDIDVIAEGVETSQQRDFLQACNCAAYQGYLFGRPMPAGDFEAFIRRTALAPPAA